MRKVSYICITIFAFFATYSDVHALEAGSTSDREIIYKIDRVSIEKDNTIVEGYAYLDKHNNYHTTDADAYGLTSMNIYAQSGTKTIEPEKLEFTKPNTTVGNYDPDAICWERSCIKVADEKLEEGFYYADADPNHPFVNVKSENCIYKNVYFKATFKTRNFNNERNMKLKIEIGYDPDQETRPCTEYVDGAQKNSNILQKLDTLYWGHPNEETIEVKKVNSCSINGKSCSQEQELDYGVIKTKVSVVNTSSEFKMSFSTGSSSNQSIVDYNKNMNLSLSCENGYFSSGTSEKVSKTYSITRGTGRCRKTVSKTISANYIIIETGALEFSLDRGPIYAGGAFQFKVDYTTVAKWHYVDEVPECPLITVNGVTPKTRTVKTKNGTKTVKYCAGSESGYDPECDTAGESRQRFEEKITKDKYRALNSGNTSKPNVNLKMDNNNNSNSVINPTNGGTIGEWKCTNDKTMDSRWEPNTDWVTTCTYELKDSHLNRQSADVNYSNSGCGSNEICKENLYYIPLKWNDNKFDLKINFGGKNELALSTVQGINWYVDYECNVDVKQMLYDTKTGGYQFFYRPIDLNNPFPNRNPSTNWIEWWSNTANRKDLAEGYSNKEYSFTLSPNTMRNLKEYNDSMRYSSGKNLGYLNHSIDANGRSNFINRYGTRYGNASYSKLGEMK